jgi:hypothetical protein
MTKKMQISSGIALITVLWTTWGYFSRKWTLEAFAISHLLMLSFRPAIAVFVWEFTERM